MYDVLLCRKPRRRGTPWGTPKGVDPCKHATPFGVPQGVPPLERSETMKESGGSRERPSFPNSCLGTLVAETPVSGRRETGVSRTDVPKQEFGNEKAPPRSFLPNPLSPGSFLQSNDGPFSPPLPPGTGGLPGNRFTMATTPSPRVISTRVPRNSATISPKKEGLLVVDMDLHLRSCPGTSSKFRGGGTGVSPVWTGETPGPVERTFPAAGTSDIHMVDFPTSPIKQLSHQCVPDSEASRLQILQRSAVLRLDAFSS